MNEENVITGTEQVTTPAAESENNATVSATESAAGTDNGTQATADKPAEGEASTAAGDTTPSPEDAETNAQPFTIPVKYKSEELNLTAEEAVPHIQRGMMYHEKLHRLASECGKDVDGFINDLYKASERATYERLLTEAGGNENVAKRLLELEQQKKNAAYQKAQEEEKNAAQSERVRLEERLAAEFFELQAECPNYTSFEQVPQAVLKLATDKNISLYDAFLRYERAENKKIETAKQQQAQAAAASVGSQAAQPPESSVNPTMDALMAGLRRGLG